jgi:hypothetical protein
MFHRHCKEIHMIGKKKLFSSIAGLVVVAAMSFGAAQAFATPVKTGFAPGCKEHPSCPYGNAGSHGLLVCCDPM